MFDMCHGLSLLEMHSGGNDQRPDVVLLRWAFLVQGDLILFITGAGSAQQCLQAAVLALLVLRPLWAFNAPVCE